MPNGYHHVNQRIFLHRLQWGKLDFDDFWGTIFKNNSFGNKALKGH